VRPAGEETVIASFRHACLLIQRDRPPFDDNLAGVVCPGGLRTLDVPQRRGLRTACKRRESHSVGNIGDGIAVRVDLELVQRISRKGLGRGRFSRVETEGRMHV